MYSYVLLALVASATAKVIVNSGCPDVKAVDNFKIASFGNGVWYEVGRYPNDAETGGECGEAIYTPEGDGYKVRSTDVANKKLRVIEGSAKLASDAGNTGIVVQSLPYGVNGAIAENNLWVLDTDYDNYAVGYYCKYDEGNKSRQDFAWVLSRSKKLEGDAKAAVDKVIKESSFLDASKFIQPDFSDEACKVEA